MFTESQYDIIKYCAEECERQGSGGKSVYNMIMAWEYASLRQGEITTNFIENLGILVEPEKNKKGFRTVRIFVSDGWTNIEKDPPERVLEHLGILLESFYDKYLTIDNEKARSLEDQFYFEYENIHPFVDGNGRTGKIIYNYLLGRLNDPILPPNFWGVSNF